MPQQENKIHEIELNVNSLSSTVEFQGKMLVEIKSVLERQSEILAVVSETQRESKDLREDLEDLQRVFSDRKNVTDKNNEEFRAFTNKARGVILACAVFFSIVQVTIGFVLNDNYQSHKEFQQEIKQLEKELAVIKAHEAINHPK